MIIKVCGMRDAENIQQLSSIQHVDWIGFIFTDKSKRYVFEKEGFAIDTVKKKVGVFVDSPISEVGKRVEGYNLDIIQLHGFESPEYCTKMRMEIPSIEIMKAFHIDDKFDFDETNTYDGVVDYFLFDAKGPAAGGNGIQFNWDLIENYRGTIPFLLAGGIDPTAVSQIQNYFHEKWIGIDINSGFEIKPALKDIQAIVQFTKEIKTTIQNSTI